MAKYDANPDHNFDVTEASGYEFEERQTQRFANGWGGTQTRLPKGHLARRDTPTSVKVVRAGSGGAESDDGD